MTVESDYYEFMGFDRDNSRSGLSHYVQYFAGRDPVLELACGRGQFLELLGEAGVTASGVDSDAGMVAECTARGLSVAAGDALDFVDAAAPASYGGVFAAHFLEHLHPDQATRLLAGVRRALRPGGRLVLAVPNPGCYAVLSHDFWRDPTHVRFYEVSLVAFLCDAAGLTVEETGGNPRNHPGPPPETNYASPTTVHPPLGADIRAAIEQVTHRREQDLAARLGHLVNVLDERLRETQEQLATLHRVHAALVQLLWQPNEVYVVARA